MTTYLVVTQSNLGIRLRAASAANITTLETAIEGQLTTSLQTGDPLERVAISATGRLAAPLADGELLIGIVQLDAGTKIIPGVNPATPVSSWNNTAQPAIADLGVLTVTTVAQANTAIQAIRTSYNTLLAELRAAGVLAP